MLPLLCLILRLDNELEIVLNAIKSIENLMLEQKKVKEKRGIFAFGTNLKKESKDRRFFE